MIDADTGDNCNSPHHEGCPRCLYTYCPTCERYFDHYGTEMPEPEWGEDVPSETCKDCQE